MLIKSSRRSRIATDDVKIYSGWAVAQVQRRHPGRLLPLLPAEMGGDKHIAEMAHVTSTSKWQVHGADCQPWKLSGYRALPVATPDRLPGPSTRLMMCCAVFLYSCAIESLPRRSLFRSQGQLWRCSNPVLSDEERRHLVCDLMEARRAVKKAKAPYDDEQLYAARAAVAKATGH